MAPKATVELMDFQTEEFHTEPIEEVLDYPQDGAGRYALVMTEDGQRALASMHSIMIHP